MDTPDDKPKLCQVVQPHEPRVEPGSSLRHILDVSPGALMVADHRGTITHANRSAKDILGTSPEQLVGRRVNELSVRLATLEGIPIDPQDNPMARVLRDQTEIINEEMELITPVGDLKFLLVSSAPLTDEHGCFAGVVSSFIDITDRKRSQKALEESERRLRLMLDNMNDIVFLLDTQANLIYVSPSVERHTGWSQDELMAMGPLTSVIDRLIYPDDRDKMMDHWQRSLRGERPNDVEFRGYTRDGRILWLSASWSPVIDEEGRMVAVQGAVRDITERVLAREARVRLAEEKRNFYKATTTTDNTVLTADLVDIEQATSQFRWFVKTSFYEPMRESCYQVSVSEARSLFSSTKGAQQVITTVVPSGPVESQVLSAMFKIME